MLTEENDGDPIDGDTNRKCCRSKHLNLLSWVGDEEVMGRETSGHSMRVHNYSFSGESLIIPQVNVSNKRLHYKRDARHRQQDKYCPWKRD